MSPSKFVPTNTNKRRKPYEKPTATKLTPEAARATLESKSIPGDEQAERLLEAIQDATGETVTSSPNDSRGQGMGRARDDLGVPQASIFRRAAFAVVLLLLLATPLLLLVAAVSTGSALHDVVGPHAAIWFPLWAVFAVWVALDASALCGFAGPRPDPLGPKALSLSALAVANIISMFLFVILTKGR